MGDTITYFGGAKKPRSRAVFELANDLNDHYWQLASYLRLNGMVPPSVKVQKTRSTPQQNSAFFA